jgi:hypothetical protein
MATGPDDIPDRIVPLNLAIDVWLPVRLDRALQVGRACGGDFCRPAEDKLRDPGRNTSKLPGISRVSFLQTSGLLCQSDS